MNAQISVTVTSLSKTRLGTVTARVSACPSGRGLCHMWQDSAALETSPEEQTAARRIQQCPLWYSPLLGAAVPLWDCPCEWQPARQGAGLAAPQERSPGPRDRPLPGSSACLRQPCPTPRTLQAPGHARRMSPPSRNSSSS